MQPPLADVYALLAVGTGFATSFFLRQYLAHAPASAKVLVLERGQLFPHARRLEALRGTGLPDPNPEAAATFVNRRADKHWHFSIGFGGSSNCWYGCTPRFLPSDFRMRSLYGVGSDWPLRYEDLDPYYEQVERLMDVSGPARTPFPRRAPYPLPPHAFTDVDRRMQAAHGPLYVSQPTARASRPVNGRNACCASAVCSVCPVDAKFTVENSRLGVYEDPRVRVLWGAAATRLDLQGGRAQGLHFVQDGVERRVAGEAIALGANALFNANLLLNSGDAHPLTGRGLGEQLGLNARAYLKGLQTLGGSTWVNANGYMLYDGEHRRERAACLMEANNAPYIRLETGRWREMAVFRMIFEDLPQERNFVSTTADVLRPEVHFSGPSDYTLRGVAHMKKALPAVLSCLPVERIDYDPPFPSEAHILGTTRMGASPQEGVIDRHLLHHRWRNVFVLGSGSFPTYTPSNPTLTLSALSLLAADRTFGRGVG